MPGMSDRGALRRRRSFWLYLLLALLAMGARLLPAPRTIDDAFITFRYAHNLLAGSGFVFNAGERVLGTTTPLYACLLAGVAAATRSENYPWLALLVNSAADALTCVLLVGLGHKLSGQRWVGGAAAGLWAIAPMSVTFAVGGMETSVFILLLVASAYAYLRQRTRPAAVLAALLLLTRPDGALFVLPLILDLVFRRARARSFPFAEAGLFLAVLAPWAVFATAYFGSPLPHSIAAKALAYRLPPEAALVRLLQHYGTPFFEHDVLGRYWPLAGVVIYLALNLVGGLAAVRRESRAWPVVIFPWLYLVAYAAANPLIFRWYLAPPLPFYFVLILTGVYTLLGDLLRAGRAAQAETLARWGVAVAGLVFGALSLNQWTLRPDHGPARPAPQMAWHQLELLYTAVGEELAPHVTAQTVVAAGDVGALGYYSDARILDTVGLMSPQATAYYPLDPALYVINYAIPPQLILDTRPDYVVLLEVYGRAGLLRDERFVAAYTLAESIPTDIYESRGLLVYRRNAP
jgi:hypothetical protein